MKKHSKQSSIVNVPDATIGIDLGSRRSHFCVIDASGEMIGEGSIPTKEPALRQLLSRRESCRVVMEVGSMSAWVSRIAKSLGHQVFVANVRRVKAIYANEHKNDRNDARLLARIGRLDPKLLSPIEHRSAEAHADLAVLRARRALVETRTSLINHIRGVTKTEGVVLPKCTTEAFAKKMASRVPERLRPALCPLLEQISTLNEALRRYDQKIQALARDKYPETVALTQVTGVGPITSLTFVLTIEDPTRFPHSRNVGAYLGLTPRQDQSCDSAPQLRITKAGDRELRALLIQCAHYVLGHFGPDTQLKRHGLRLMERGGKNAKKRAIVAVARKLAVLLHALWSTGECYDPYRGIVVEQSAAA